MHKTSVLILPGLYNSGPEHWQSVWESMFPNMKRVHQCDWDTPVCDDWVAQLNSAVEKSGKNVVLVAHSLACVLVGRWVEKHSQVIRGALLVAPSDTEAEIYPAGTTGFTPMPVCRFPFPSKVVVSSNDIYVSVQRARFFAECWGSELIMAGALGHLGADSKLGSWPMGLDLLSKLSGDVYTSA